MIRITHHAVQRFQERVANLPEAEVRAALSTRAFEIAATLGTCCVILPQGHRAVVADGAVITIYPPKSRPRRIAPRLAVNTTWIDETP